MKKMDNKGFTLVEALVMITVLVILMGVTVPNIRGIIENQRNNTYETDAEKLYQNAQTKLNVNKKLPGLKAGECLIMGLNYLNDNDDLNNGPNGGKYLPGESMVIIKRIYDNSAKTSHYEFTIRLVEQVDDDERAGVEVHRTNTGTTVDVKDFEIDDESSPAIPDNPTADDLSTHPYIRGVCPNTATSQVYYYSSSIDQFHFS